VKAPWDGPAGAAFAPCGAACNRVSIGNSNMGMSTGVCDRYECIGYRPSGDVYYEYATVIVDPGVPIANVPEFATGAIADLDGDATIAGFEYGTSNLAGAAASMIAAALGDPNGVGALVGTICVTGIAPASEVVDCTPQQY